MPAFTFEKISPPDWSTGSRPVSKQANVGRSRTLIVQMLDRFAIARLKRDEADLPPPVPRKPPPD